MTKERNILVRNYAAFIPVEDDVRVYTILTDDAGLETGIEVKGMLTTFDVVNENRLNFDRKSYDDVVSNYFEANNLNIPLDLMHVRDDVRHLAGIVRKFTKKNGGVEITGFIPKGVYYYNLIKVMLDNGMLQGFSNLGWINDGEYIRETDSYTVKSFRLISASMVDIPADVGGKFISNATEFEGFHNKEKDPTIKDNIFNLIGL